MGWGWGGFGIGMDGMGWEGLGWMEWDWDGDWDLDGWGGTDGMGWNQRDHRYQCNGMGLGLGWRLGSQVGQDGWDRD